MDGRPSQPNAGAVTSSGAGWSVPVNATRWPAKSRAIAAWLVTGIEAWRTLEASNGGCGAVGSNEATDRLTLHPGIRRGEIGQTALLIVGGATEMLRGLASMYECHARFPMARAHLPVVRSLQEHCGRAIWLLEPGLEFGDASGPIEDDEAHTAGTTAFRQRSSHMIMLNEELLDDRLAAAKKLGDESAIDAARNAGALSPKRRSAARQEAGLSFPGYSGFAEIAEHRTQLLHLVAEPARTRSPYSRISETSHGTMLGLLGDSAAGDNGTRPFVSDERDLEAIAAHAARWWVTAVGACSTYFGWDWEAAMYPFDGASRALFGVGSD